MSKKSLWIDKLHVSYIQLRNIEQEQNRIVVQFGHNEESIQGKKFSYMEKCHLAVNRQIILVYNEYSLIVLWQTMYRICGKLTTTDTGRWFGANHAHVFVYWFTIPVMLQPPIPVNPKKNINKCTENVKYQRLLLFWHRWTLTKSYTTLETLNGRYEWLHIHGIKISH